MSTISKPFTFSANTTISSSQMNSNFDTIYNDYNGGIAAANLASNAVTTAKISDSNVTTAKIADSNVTTAKIADDAVTPAKWTNPYCFRAYDSAGTTLTDATAVEINFGTEVYDYNNNFASNGYTAPVAGVYHFDASVGVSTLATGVNMILGFYLNDVLHSLVQRQLPALDSAIGGGTDILLAAGEKVTVRVNQDSAGNETTVTGATRTFFSGHLVHAI